MLDAGKLFVGTRILYGCVTENTNNYLSLRQLCEVNGPQVDRALVKGSRRSRCQHDHTKETNGRRPPKRPHNPNKKGEKTTKPNQPTGQPHTGTDQKPTPAGADRRQERTRTPHPPAQGRKAPMASRMLGEQASKQVNHGHATRYLGVAGNLGTYNFIISLSISGLSD